MPEIVVTAKMPWEETEVNTWEYPKYELLGDFAVIAPEYDTLIPAFEELCERLNIVPVDKGYCREANPLGVGYSDFFVRFSSANDAMRVKLGLE